MPSPDFSYFYYINSNTSFGHIAAFDIALTDQQVADIYQDYLKWIASNQSTGVSAYTTGNPKFVEPYANTPVEFEEKFIEHYAGNEFVGGEGDPITVVTYPAIMTYNQNTSGNYSKGNSTTHIGDFNTPTESQDQPPE